MLLLKFCLLFCDTGFWNDLTLTPLYVHMNPYIYTNVIFKCPFNIIRVYVIISKKPINNLINLIYTKFYNIKELNKVYGFLPGENIPTSWKNKSSIILFQNILEIIPSMLWNIFINDSKKLRTILREAQFLWCLFFFLETTIPILYFQII